MDIDSKGRISIMEISAVEGQLIADGLRVVEASLISCMLQKLVDIAKKTDDNDVH